jgi:hypothetical protein
MDQIAFALVVAAIVSLTTIAYKHPSSYQKWIARIDGGLLLVLIGMALWDTSNVTTYRNIFPAIVKATGISKELEINKIAESIRVPAIYYAGIIGLMGYTYCLLWLPDVLREGKKRKKKRNKE